MTTVAYSDTSSHTSDATFRYWGLSINTHLASAGLVQAADTGQINWATATRPAANGNAGYEIWYLNDSLHGTAPIYMKLLYGTYSATANPRVSWAVGTGTDGAGNLTGIATTSRAWNANSGGSASALQCAICVNEGFFGISWMWGLTTCGFFAVSRSCDSSGTPTADACIVVWGGGTSATPSQWLNFTNAVAGPTNESAKLALMPGGQGTGLISGTTYQTYMCWMGIPTVVPVFAFTAIFTGDFTQGTTFSATLVGSTARTYMALPSTGVGVPGAVATGATSLAILWE